MQWNSQAIILKHQPFSEEKLLCTLFTVEHGLYKGLVSINSKTRTQIQIGNLVDVTWKARLPEHLGIFYCELLKPLSITILNNRQKLNSVISISAIISTFLPEKVKELQIYNHYLSYILSLKEQEDWLIDYLHLEMTILKELGYGLDLSSCVVTGKKEDLFYVSPKSGKAVSKEVGLAYHDKLLKLPGFFIDNSFNNKDDILAGFKLTRHFIIKHLCHPPHSELPSARIRFEELISNFINISKE